MIRIARIISEAFLWLVKGLHINNSIMLCEN